MAERDHRQRESTADQEQDASSLTDLVPIDRFTETPPIETTSTPRPDPVEPRPYLELRPSEAPVDPRAVTRAMERVDVLLRRTTRDGLRHKLRRTTIKPKVEWLLVSDGRADPRVRYLIGSNVSDLTEDLEGIARTCFPNSYELAHRQWHPRFVEEHLPIVTGDNRTTNDDPTDRDGPHHPAITPATPYAAGVEYVGRAELKQDWQTPLTPFEAFTGPPHRTRTHARRRSRAESRRVPLAGVIETIRDAELPVCFQVVAEPYGDWSGLAKSYTKDLDRGIVSVGDRIWNFLFPPDRETLERYTPPPDDRKRIDGIASRDPRHTLRVSARAVALTRDRPSRADAVARQLATVLAPINGRFHELEGQVATDDELYSGIGPPPGSAIYEDLIHRAIYYAVYHQLGDWLRRRPHQSRGIVVTPEELPSFCILDGAGLTPNGRRAVAARPAERTGLPLPPPGQLAQYRGPGLPLCRPLTHDRQDYGGVVSIAPSLQPRHLVVGGASGAGKSVNMVACMLGNAFATDGPNVLFDLKGDSMAEEYCRAHYAAFGSLEDVSYFDCTEFLPALSFFDVRSLLDAGVPREEAVSRTAGHYEEILKGVMGTANYEQAVVSPQVIATHIMALFDPVHGEDAFAHRDLLTAISHTKNQRSGPPVSDDDLERHFSSLVEDDPRMFAQVMAGARTRVERIGLDRRIAPVFNHVPGDGNADGVDADEPRFDFADHLDSDHVLIFDFGGMEAAAKRTLTLVLLSSLWSALKARAQHADRRGTDTVRPVVNLFLEEAASVADTELVDTLLSQGRSFGCSVTMGLQFLAQLRSTDTDTYYEALNETATFLLGSVALDEDLNKALATETMPPAEVNTRLSALSPGEWFVRLGAEYAEETPRPFLSRSLPAPPGHSASDEPLTTAQTIAFQHALDECRERTKAAHGLAHEAPSTVDHDADDPRDGTDETDDVEDLLADPPRLDSLLPYTERLPDPVDYDEARHAIVCASCENRYNPFIDGMVNAIECCHSLADVDRDDIPVCSNNLKRSIEEIAASEWSIRQHLLTQAIYNAQQCEHDPLEYDIVDDSMIRLQEYVGIDADEVQELLDAGVIRHDADHPHRLYSVAPDARSIIGEAYRRGVEYGHGKGDLEESAEHVFGMEVAKRWATTEYVENPNHPGVELSPYHELDSPTDEAEQRRLDLAVLDADGDVVVAVEVERINHDYREAVPVDYDKMAACDPDEAVWIVMKQAAGHKVLSALNDPPDGEPRVEKTYAETTPPQQFRIDEPGFTAMYPAEYVRDNLLED